MDEPYFSEEIASYLNKSDSINNLSALDGLTKSEKKIVFLIAENKSSQQIADELNVSIKTIHKHRSNIVSKLNLDHKPSALSVWARVNKDLF